MNTESWTARLGALIEKYRLRADLSQAALAELVSREAGHRVRQGQVSAHINGRQLTRDGSLPGAYARALRIPEAELAAAMGYPTDEETPVEEVRTFADVVREDPTLSKAAKAHLISQYGLLQLASKHAPADDEPNNGAETA